MKTKMKFAVAAIAAMAIGGTALADGDGWHHHDGDGDGGWHHGDGGHYHGGGDGFFELLMSFESTLLLDISAAQNNRQYKDIQAANVSAGQVMAGMPASDIFLAGKAAMEQVGHAVLTNSDAAYDIITFNADMDRLTE